MRVVYTTGVLDYYMEQKLYSPYVATVSAGAVSTKISSTAGFADNLSAVSTNLWLLVS